MSTLTEAEGLELLEAIEQMRKTIRNQKSTLHGWELQFEVRRNDRSRADMCVITPEGRKIFSIVGVKRALGMAAEPAPRVDRRADDDDDNDDLRPTPKTDLFSDGLVLPEGRARRTRKEVNYAELDGPGAGTGAPKLRQLVQWEVGGGLAPGGEADLPAIVHGIVASGER